MSKHYKKSDSNNNAIVIMQYKKKCAVLEQTLPPYTPI